MESQFVSLAAEVFWALGLLSVGVSSVRRSRAWGLGGALLGAIAAGLARI